MNSEPYKEVLRAIISPFVKYPQHLDISENSTTHATTLNVRGHKADQGKIIGGRAANIQAIQRLMDVIGRKRQHRVSVTVLESQVGDKEPNPPYTPDPNWNRADDERMESLLAKVVVQCFGQSIPVKTEIENGDKTFFTLMSETVPTEIEAALSTLFRAIGKSQGRVITIKVYRSTAVAV